jgi:hypothetical protein
VRWLGPLCLVAFISVQGCRCAPVPCVDCGFPFRDGGQPDSGAPDAGGPDGGDAGVPDAGDAGDAGAPDGGDAGAPDAGDAGQPDAGLGFCENYFTASCNWWSKCGRLDAPQFKDCIDLARWQCSQRQLDVLTDAGKLVFNSGTAATCYTALVASSCSLPYPSSPACGSLFDPNTPVGGSCTRQWSTVCQSSYCGANSCPASCTAYLALDAGCTGTFGDECGPGAYCDSATLRCAGALALGSPCTANDRCAGSLCDTAQGKCVALGSVTLDGGCGSDVVCSFGNYCKVGHCAPSETVGGPCRLYGGSDCQSNLTCRLDAGTTGFCVPRSGLDGGCYGLPNDCEDGLLCDSTSLGAPGTCFGYGSEDAGCVYTLQNCKVGLLCDATTARCRRLPRVGEPCTRDPGNFRSSDCADGFCPAGDAGTTRCLAPQDGGAPCERPWECASTECESGVCASLCETF